jgi:hypothetical protein
LINVAFDPEEAKDLIFDGQNISLNEMGNIENAD